MVETPAETAREAVVEAEGDFVAFFREYRNRAFHFALQLTGSREDAMDLTQEAFLRLHRHWGRRDPNRPPGPWLYAILRHAIVDWRRRLRRDEVLEASGEGAAVESRPDVLAERQERAALVWEAIRRLPPEQREAVILRDWHGLSYKEIAQVQGVSTGVVGSRLFDAREKLRKHLKGRL